MDKKVLVVNREILLDLKKNFNLEEDSVFNRFEYSSPNGFIKKNISLVEIEEYRTPNFSFPTSDLNQYENIAEDILDYKKFMDSFELEDFEVAINRVIERFN